MQFVPDLYKTQGMCDKVVDSCPFAFDSVPDQYKTQEMCQEVVFKEPLMLKYYLNRYKTQEMCDEAVDVFLPTISNDDVVFDNA